MRTFVWYDYDETEDFRDQNDDPGKWVGGIEESELFGLLRRHGFVDGQWNIAPAELRQRVEELAADMFDEVLLSERERNSEWTYRERCRQRELEELGGMVDVERES